MNRKEKIYQKLQNELKPEFLEVVNNSYLHKGHLGDDGTMETHFCINIKSSALNGLSRVQAHQKINQIIKDEFSQGLHALEIKINA